MFCSAGSPTRCDAAAIILERERIDDLTAADHRADARNAKPARYTREADTQRTTGMADYSNNLAALHLLPIR
jgi:hypothetical protein